MTRTRLAVLAVLLVVVGATGGVAGSTPVVSAAETTDCTFPLSGTDATGANVTVAEEPDSVVALAPSGAQVLWAVGAQQKVVGMPMSYTEYLEGSRNRTEVLTESFQPDIETVVSLEPDLVLAPNVVVNETVENLRSKGLTVFRFAQADSIADVTEKTRLTGRLVGHYEQAATVSQTTTATVNAIRQATTNRTDPSVYYALGGGYTAGASTFIGDVIDAAGGDNIADAANISTYGVISEEVVAAENPEWIVMPGERQLRKSAAINATTAVQEGNILRVDANFISQPGPRVTQPLTTMAGTFHPETAGDLAVDPNSVSVPSCASDMGMSDNETTTENDSMTDGDEMTQTVQITTATMNDTDGDTTTATGDGPGFGVVAALVALVAAALLARRE